MNCHKIATTDIKLALMGGLVFKLLKALSAINEKRKIKKQVPVFTNR